MPMVRTRVGTQGANASKASIERPCGVTEFYRGSKYASIYLRSPAIGFLSIRKDCPCEYKYRFVEIIALPLPNYEADSHSD